MQHCMSTGIKKLSEPDAPPISLVGLIGGGELRSILRLCAEYEIVPMAVAELGDLGFAVVVPGGFLRYFRRQDGRWEYARDACLFSGTWRRRVVKLLRVLLADPDTPRRQVKTRRSNTGELVS